MTTFRLNGREVSVKTPDDAPLLWAIRDEIGLTGTKFGCGIGACGACTVHVEGRLARACSLPASAAAGKRVTTVEGLAASAGGALHPLQRAWLEEDVSQCGYCQAGQLMAAAALLAEHPRPTDAQIDAAMSGNVCRCGTYQRIRRAIHRAAALAASTPAPAATTPAPGGGGGRP